MVMTELANYWKTQKGVENNDKEKNPKRVQPKSNQNGSSTNSRRTKLSKINAPIDFHVEI